MATSAMLPGNTVGPPGSPPIQIGVPLVPPQTCWVYLEAEPRSSDLSNRQRALSMQVALSTSSPQRKLFRRLSILAGNVIQIAGLVAACGALAFARSVQSKPAAIALMLSSWILLYFCCHAIAHWSVGRTLGIRFAFYTIGGTGNPFGYPTGIRWLFERLPFFGVQTEKASMQNASPSAKAIMWSAGGTSSDRKSTRLNSSHLG